MMERTVTNHCAHTAIEIENRCETEIDSTRAQLDRRHPPAGARDSSPEFLVPIVEYPVLPRGGKSRESFSKTLHPAAFVVDGDKQRRLFQCMNGFAQPAQLLRTVKIARKQYDAADAGMAQHISLDQVELRARDSCHEEAQGHDRQRRSVTVAGSCGIARAAQP